MAHPDQFDERNTLRAMLGLRSEPVLLDIKPVDKLTPGERRRLTERLAELERPVPAPEPTVLPKREPVAWWKWWLR
jgi:hypothetical protein